MDDTKNKSILEKEVRQEDTRSEKEREIVANVFEKFSDTADNRNQNFNNFDGLNLIEYINDSHRRTTTNVDVRDEIEDWQATIHDPFTRNKVMTILSKIAQILPDVELENIGDDDFRKALSLNGIFQWSNEYNNDFEDFSVKFLFEAIVKGTAIGYEGYENKVQKIRDIKSGTDDDIVIKENTKVINRLYSKVWRLEDFYPAHVGVSSIKDMPYCFTRRVMPLEIFRQDYAGYSKVDKVEGKNTTYGDGEEVPFNLDYISQEIEEGSVEVISYYNKDTDEYIVIANGIWLNPLYSGGEEVTSPIPFTHKDLPFYETKFELYDVDFFYGKSLPDKLKNLQDVLNVLTNMVLDQSFLTIFAPILTNGADSIEDDYLRPGRRTPIDTQGLPIKDAVHTLDMKTPSGWHQYILNYTRNIMEEASVDSVSSGQAGVGGRTTAQEIRTASEGVAAVLDLFVTFVRTALKRRAMLRIKNIQQFWTDPKYPVIQRVLGDGQGEDTSDVFNSFKIRNTKLSTGNRGTQIIEFYKDKNKRPTAKELKDKALISKLTNNVNIEYLALDPGYIRDTEFDIKFVPNKKQSKEIEQALHLEKVRVYKTLFPGMANDTELFAQTAEMFGDDPEKIMNPDVLNPQEEEGVETGMSTEPQNNVAQNSVNGLTGTGAGNSPIQLGR